jgi:monoamine oxidase
MVPRCDHCHLTVMACPDLRWAMWHDVYPLWMTKSMADRVAGGDPEGLGRPGGPADKMAEAWATNLKRLGLA